MKRPATMERPGAASSVDVEYPQEGELITSSSYTFRIAGSAPRVEIAIDGGDWRPCRRSDDYWWFDWADYDSGRHQAIVRGSPRPGEESVARVRRFLVEAPAARGRR